MKTRSFFTALTAALLLGSSAFSQQFVRISGSVLNQEKVPLENARVTWNSSDKVFTEFTDETGRFTLLIPEKTSGTIEVRAVGYQTNKRDVLVSNSDATIDFVLNERYKTTEEVIVSSTRPSENAPVSKVTRNREDIERVYQGQDGGFLLEELSPSIVTYSESGTNLSNYAGIRLRGIDQTRVNMTLNGVPLNDMIDQGVFFSNFTDFGKSIESVQIQRGVGTSSNGTSSYAGSINFESINLEKSQAGGTLMFTTGSFGTIRGGAEVQSGLLKNNTAFYLRYTETHSDGYRYNMGTNARSFFFSGGYFGDQHSFKLTGFNGRSKNGLGYIPVAISDIKNDPRTNYVSQNDEDDFGQFMTQLQHIYMISETKNLVSSFYYSGAGGNFPFGFEDFDGSFAQINYPLYNDHLGAMSTFNADFFARTLKTNIGVHASRFFRNNVEQFVPNFASPYYSDHTRKDEFSLFVKSNYDWKSFSFYGDVQARSVGMIFYPDQEFLSEMVTIPKREWLFVNATVGMSYKIAKQLIGYASFGRTGREPTRFDILGSTQINPFNLSLVQDINQVVPEFVNNAELGIRWNSKQLRLQLNGFFMQFENEIAPIGEFIPQGFVQVYRNQEASQRYGAELDISYQFLPQFNFSGNLTYMQATISSYEDIATGEVFENVNPILSPELNAQAVLSYSPFENLTLSIRGRFLSDAFMELTNNPDFIVPQSLVSDFRVRYKFYKEHSINIQLNNITNERYFTYGAPTTAMSGAFEPGYYVQPPRHLYVTLLLQF
jgi:iron complex outermembrane receptor protein